MLCSGYMAPEYALICSVSPKIDIFSFGVLVLEIVSRRRNSNSDEHSNVNLISDVSEVLILLLFAYHFLQHLCTKAFILLCLDLELLPSLY